MTQLESAHELAEHSPFRLIWAFRVWPWLTTMTGLSIIPVGSVSQSGLSLAPKLLLSVGRRSVKCIRERENGKGSSQEVQEFSRIWDRGSIFLQMKGSDLRPDWVIWPFCNSGMDFCFLYGGEWALGLQQRKGPKKMVMEIFNPLICFLWAWQLLTPSISFPLCKKTPTVNILLFQQSKNISGWPKATWLGEKIDVLLIFFFKWSKLTSWPLKLQKSLTIKHLIRKPKNNQLLDMSS